MSKSAWLFIVVFSCLSISMSASATFYCPPVIKCSNHIAAQCKIANNTMGWQVLSKDSVNINRYIFTRVIARADAATPNNILTYCQYVNVDNPSDKIVALLPQGTIYAAGIKISPTNWLPDPNNPGYRFCASYNDPKSCPLVLHPCAP